MSEPTKKTNPQYNVLDADKVVETLKLLSKRISERFPESGLFGVSQRLHGIASRAKERAYEMGRPFWQLRILTGVIVLAILAIAIAPLFQFDLEGMPVHFTEFVQILEPAVNVIVLIGAAIFFLATLEIRIKRRRALSAMHEIRSIAHIIDMHQLTKDPERLRSNFQWTTSSPRENLEPHQLSRYLDYCSELLSLTGKVAVLYVQHFDDSVAIDAAYQVEQLCTGLSRKIWQKIMILDTPAKS